MWPRGSRFPRMGKVVTYHPLYHAEQSPDEETRACARRESERLAALLDRRFRRMVQVIGHISFDISHLPFGGKPISFRTK